MIYRHGIFLGRQLGKVHNSLYSAVCIFGVQDSVLISHGCFAMFSPSLLSQRLPFNRAANSNQFLSARPFPLQVSRIQIPSWQLTRLHLPAGRHSCRRALFHTSSLPLSLLPAKRKRCLIFLPKRQSAIKDVIRQKEYNRRRGLVSNPRSPHPRSKNWRLRPLGHRRPTTLYKILCIYWNENKFYKSKMVTQLSFKNDLMDWQQFHYSIFFVLSCNVLI